MNIVYLIFVHCKSVNSSTGSANSLSRVAVDEDAALLGLASLACLGETGAAMPTDVCVTRGWRRTAACAHSVVCSLISSIDASTVSR